MPFDRDTRPLIFGEVLFDVFADGETLGGAPFNVAWHLQAFGRAPLFISRIGEDARGRAITTAMSDWGLDTSGLQWDATAPTGVVRVQLLDGEPSYDIVSDQAYDRIQIGQLPPLPQNALLYHGSLALRGAVSRAALEELVDRFDPAVFIDANLRDPWWDTEAVRRMLSRATWAKLNAAELAALVRPGPHPDGPAEALREAHGLETLIITEGSAGAFAIGRSGPLGRTRPARGIRVVDAVGAGDAFAAVLILGLICDWSTQVTLDRAQSFASAVVGRRGATVRDPDFYAPFIAAWGL
ncbi:PfkB family carbohydrate kinase [Thioalkalicoccus limnaeus]|uniref:PfkB family carbohydrate kinase n=1 Tax=Thioalkalicoccus limnaeus TaxID=120681 RepID=A0ABV4BCR6_9GAMM